jgi:hypothetical protein
MMKKIAEIVRFACVAALVILSGCTEYISLNLGSSKPVLVVDGVLTTDSVNNYVRLSLSSGFFENNQTPRVSNALVKVTDGDGTIFLKESPSVRGLYLFPRGYAGVEGQTYRLSVEEVDIDGYGKDGVYEAVSTMPLKHHIDSVGYIYDRGDKEWRVLYYGKDNPDVADYYMFLVAKNDSLITDQYSEVILTDDELFNGNDFKGVMVQVIREENSEGEPMVTVMPGDFIELFVCGVTSSCYDYINALKSETGFNNPVFGGPPANLKGNISNGALGFFNTYSIVSARTKVLKK